MAKYGFKETGQSGFWALCTFVRPSKGGFKCKIKLIVLPTRSKQETSEQKALRSKKREVKEKGKDKSKHKETVAEGGEKRGNGTRNKSLVSKHDWSLKGLNIPETLYNVELNRIVEERLSRYISSEESSLCESDLEHWSSDSSIGEYTKHVRSKQPRLLKDVKAKKSNYAPNGTSSVKIRN
ncbi:hypothetical protein AYI69_g3638 [Smittium culicis]|uniref:Uncharacterized protein n=1 Tax=Smittium culicis TaxID=133412 RepID=A0A1R1YJ77_9FUNG|nr:hypothetical protein AYI69_g3638 [Smittium culicis]